jgi:hypothetical protein
MTGATDFAKMVPGFDFLQGLMTNAGSALPNMGQWIAPTLNPDELGKRIEELRTVQFWLEQNARLLAATIQALEVQRMTLSTLKSMNMPVADIANAFRLKPAAEPAAPARPEPAPAAAPEPARKSAPKAAAATAAAPGVVDPMQWWGALTQQFTQLAASALKDNPAQAATNLASDMVKQTLDSAGTALKKTSPAPARKKARNPAKSVARRP